MDIFLVWSGWTLWIILLILMLYGWIEITAKAARAHAICVPDAGRVLCLTLLASWFYLIPEWSKLHLLWLVPLVYGVTAFMKFKRYYTV